MGSEGMKQQTEAGEWCKWKLPRSIPIEKALRPKSECFTCLSVQLDRSGDLTGTHTPGTNINMAGGTVNDRLHTFHIGFPSPIGTPMRVRDLNAERNALIAELALCIRCTSLLLRNYMLTYKTSSIIADSNTKCKKIWKKLKSFLRGRSAWKRWRSCAYVENHI